MDACYLEVTKNQILNIQIQDQIFHCVEEP